MGPNGILRHIDDPSITVLHTAAGSTGKTWVSEGDSGTDFVKAVAAGKGLHYAGATHATTNDFMEFASSEAQFTGQEGHCAVEVMLQLGAVTAVAFNFGFNDQALETGGSGSLPCEISSAAWASNSGNFLGFVYDTGATNDELHCFWVDDDSDGMTDADSSVDGKAVRMKGMAPTALKWLYMRVEMQDRGSGNGVRGTFLVVDHNGRSMEKVFNTSLDRDVQMYWYLGIEARADTAVSAYIRDCNWEQTIANM